MLERSRYIQKKFLGLKVLKFKDFLLEFDQSMHFSDRSNVNKEKELSKARKSNGSRMLPFEFTPAKTGYNIIGMDDTSTGSKKSSPDLTYKDWLDMMDVNQASFEKFISELWNYQATHKVLSEKAGRTGKYYAVIPGTILIKTEGYVWRPVFNTGGGANTQMFVFQAEGNTLTTLYPINIDTSRESLLRKTYDHFYREDMGNFRDRFPSLDSFKLGEDFEVIPLAENIVVDFKNGDYAEKENAKKKIDSAYSSVKFQEEPIKFTPPPIPEGVSPNRKQFGSGDTFIYQGENGEENIDFEVSSIDNIDDIKKAQREKTVGKIDRLYMSGKKLTWTGSRFSKSDYSLEVKPGDEISVYEIVRGRRIPVKYYIGKLINSEPRIIAQDKVQMWLYPIKYKKKNENN